MPATPNAGGSVPPDRRRPTKILDLAWYEGPIQWHWGVMVVLGCGSKSISLDFESWAQDAHPQLRQALTATFGPEVADDSANEALAIAWERWADIGTRPNPTAYTFGIARNRARRHARRAQPAFPPVEPSVLPHVEPGLPDAIAALSERQRTVVGLVHGFGWSLAEVAELLGLSKSSVQNHNERGMAHLRNELGVTT